MYESAPRCALRALQYARQSALTANSNTGLLVDFCTSSIIPFYYEYRSSFALRQQGACSLKSAAAVREDPLLLGPDQRGQCDFSCCWYY